MDAMMAAANTPSKCGGKLPWILLAATLALLVSVVVCLYVTSLLAEADQAHVESTAKSVRAAIVEYEKNHGSLDPADFEGLTEETFAPALFERISLPAIDANVVGGSPRDPWGNSYAFRLEAATSGEQIVMVSGGPDGSAGTSDDVVEVVWSGEKRGGEKRGHR